MDGLGSPFGFWKRFKRLAKHALPLAQRLAPFVPGGAAALTVATPFLKQAGIAGLGEVGALYAAPDGSLYQVQGVDADESLDGLGADDELNGLAGDELQGLEADDELRGFGTGDDLDGFADADDLNGSRQRPISTGSRQMTRSKVSKVSTPTSSTDSPQPTSMVSRMSSSRAWAMTKR